MKRREEKRREEKRREEKRREEKRREEKRREEKRRGICEPELRSHFEVELTFECERKLRRGVQRRPEVRG